VAIDGSFLLHILVTPVEGTQNILFNYFSNYFNYFASQLTQISETDTEYSHQQSAGVRNFKFLQERRI
jgi:hypothetical protein